LRSFNGIDDDFMKQAVKMQQSGYTALFLQTAR
jgi:uncharacterized membrane protein